MKAMGKLTDKWNIVLRLRALVREASPFNEEQLSAKYQRLGYTKADGFYLNGLPAEGQKNTKSAKRGFLD